MFNWQHLTLELVLRMREISWFLARVVQEREVNKLAK